MRERRISHEYKPAFAHDERIYPIAWYNMNYLNAATFVTPLPQKDNSVAKPPQKCTCVPSGRCHSGTLIGCPHNHYYNENNVWTCDLTNAARPFDQKNDDAAQRYLSAFQLY